MGKAGCSTERTDIKEGVLVIRIKGTKWGNGNRKSRDVAQGEGTLKGGCFSDGDQRDKVDNRDNRESRDVAQGQGTLKGGCFSDRNKRDEAGKKQ